MSVIQLQMLCTPLTQNAKLGAGVATTYRPVGDASKGEGTCPSGCSLLPNRPDRKPDDPICYTTGFLVDRQQQASRTRYDNLDRLKGKGAFGTVA